MQGFAYFPTIVYRDERPDFVEKVLPTCKNYLGEKREAGSNFCQSASLNFEPILQELKNYLLLSSVSILRNQGYLVDNYDFYMSALWAQEIVAGEKNYGTDVHCHKNSQINGWFFLETPENGSFPIYYDVRTNKAMMELDFLSSSEIFNATNKVVFNNLQPGTVLFSNSWMTHQLTHSNTKSPTTCIHFIISHRDRLCNMC